jgi:hypothetical protein
MTTSIPDFRRGNTARENPMKEALGSQKSSTDTANSTELDETILTSKSMTIRKIKNLFSMALNESKNLRADSLTQKELGLRFEELIDTLRLQTIKALETRNE